MLRKIARPLPETIKKPLRDVLSRLRFARIGLKVESYAGPLELLGNSYGGYVLPRNELPEGSICWCFGAGEDISFESELAAALPVDVHIFDPTPRSIAYVSNLFDQRSSDTSAPGRLSFHPWGIWSSDQSMKFYAPANPTHVSHSVVNLQHTTDYFLAECKRPRSIMRSLGHEKVSLIKLNIEGAEYEAMKSIFEDRIDPKVIVINFDELHTQLDANALARLRGLVRQFAEQGYHAVSAVDCQATFVHSLSEWLRYDR